MSTNQFELMPTFEDAMKAEEKIVFLVEYLKSDQFYPEYCTAVSQDFYIRALRTTFIISASVSPLTSNSEGRAISRLCGGTGATAILPIKKSQNFCR